MTARRILAATAVLGALAVPVAAGASTATPAASKNLVQIAAADPHFSTLVKLVQQAGLADTLATGTWTVFAPTNAAFAKVPKATLTALANDPAKLKAVLLYHVVKGKVPASKVVKLKSAKTAEGASVSIRVKHGSVYLNGSRKVTKTDVMASNGIIHVIDGVLLPPGS